MSHLLFARPPGLLERKKQQQRNNKAKSKKIAKKNTSKKMFLEKIRPHFLHKTFNQEVSSFVRPKQRQ